MSKIIVIKGVKVRIIKIKGIWYYKYHYCKCKCGNRIQVKKSHKLKGIPEYISGHNTYLWSDEVEQKRIRNIAKSNTGKVWDEERKKRWINPMKGKHRTQEFKDMMSELGRNRPWKESSKIKQSNSMKGNTNYAIKHTEEAKKNMSIAKKKYCQEHPEKLKLLIEASKKYYRDNPGRRTEQIKNMHEKGKKTNTKIELVVQKQVKILTDKPFEINYPIIDYKNNKIYFVDILIPHFATIIEVNGCYIHKCIDCYPLQEDINIAIDKHYHDTQRIIKLEKMGFKVVVIWEHDITSGKYKKTLKNIFKEVS